MHSAPLRIALLVDPLSMFLDESRGVRGKWGDHAPALARELLGRGHVVRGFGAPPGLIPRSGEELEPGGHAKRRGWRSLGEFRPQVIVAYDPLSSAAFRGARAARRHAAGLVLVEAAFHGERSLEARLVRFGARLWGPYVRRTARAVVALDATARLQAEHAGFAPGLLREIPPGVDLVRFRPGLTSPLVARHRIRGRILLYFGRLDEARGIDILLGAFARTVGQREDWNLVIAGDGPRRGELAVAAARRGIADRVHLLPRPREEELPGLMGASTLMAIPARDAAVVGRWVGHALACGLPVMISDLPRLRGLVRSGETGLVVPPGDPSAWEEALGRAASAPEARKRWSLNARAYAERELGWPTIGAHFEEVLLRAHSSAAAPPHADPVPGEVAG